METNLRDTSVPATPVFRILEPKECEKRLRVLGSQEFEDIILRPSKNKDLGGISNVPYRIKDAWFFAWGYLGNGPHETAVNILLHFSGGDYDFARDFCQEFVVEVISKLPNRESVLLSARSIFCDLNFEHLSVQVLNQKYSKEISKFIQPSGRLWPGGKGDYVF